MPPPGPAAATCPRRRSRFRSAAAPRRNPRSPTEPSRNRNPVAPTPGRSGALVPFTGSVADREVRHDDDDRDLHDALRAGDHDVDTIEPDDQVAPWLGFLQLEPDP